LVTGEPGVGKTSLAAALATRALEDGALVLGGQSEAGLFSPYQPFVDMFRRMAASGVLPASSGGELSHFLAIDMPPGRTRLPDESVDPTTERLRLFSDAARLLAGAAAGRPLVVILDDVHVADHPTVLLARYLVEQASPPGLLVVATADSRSLSPELEQDLLGIAAVAAVDGLAERSVVTGLAEEGVATQVSALAGVDVDAASRSFARQVADITDGNPLFVAQVVDDLLEAGAMRVTGERLAAPVDLTGYPSGPSGLRAVVARRLAKVSPAARRVLAAGAVLGSEFTMATLRATMSEPDSALRTALDEGLSGGFVVEETVADGVVCTFRHGVIREIMYESLPPLDRQRLHLRVAHALESLLSPGPMGQHAATIAAHHRLAGGAGDPDKAVEWSVRAGERAARVFAFEEAAAQVEAAAVTLGELGGAANELRRARLLERLASLRFFGGRESGAAVRCAEEALALYERHGETTRAAKVHSQLGTYFVTVGG
ncbi:MAG: ATP-binding protein, partial [Acidimicrobiales bacterium]